MTTYLPNVLSLFGSSNLLDIKDKEYKLFTNTVFDKENEAEDFGKKSMKRNYEHKVLEYNKENYDRYWNEKDK